MPCRGSVPAATTAAAAALKRAIGINGAMAAALGGKGSKADSNPLRALEEQTQRELESELRKVTESFYNHNAMKLMAKQAATHAVPCIAPAGENHKKEGP